MVDRQQILQNHLDIIMGKMFEMVNLDYKTVWPEYKDDPEWFWRNEWSAKTESEFVEWLTQYLMGNSGARKAIMRFPLKNKKNCQGTAIWFNVQYGWKTKKDEAKG